MRSPWARFVDFWIMCELGEYDATYRSYIRSDRFYDNLNHVNDASARMRLSVEPGGYAWQRVLEEVHQRFTSLGHTNVKRNTIRIRLNQWFVYDKIQTGEIWVHSQLVRDAKAALADNPLF